MKSVDVHTNRIRHRGRIESVYSRLRKFVAHQVEAAAQMNAIGGVANVSNTDIVGSIRNNLTINPIGRRRIRAEYQRGVTTIAGVEALGIPII